MPSVSTDTAPTEVTWEGVDIEHADLEGGYAVCFQTHTADADRAPLFRGLPEDRARLPRWGYVIEILNETIPVVSRNLDANGIEFETSETGEAVAGDRS